MGASKKKNPNNIIIFALQCILGKWIKNVLDLYIFWTDKKKDEERENNEIPKF